MTTETKQKKQLFTDLPKGTYFYGLGRRKRAIAQVRLYDGSGKMHVNGREAKHYFDAIPKLLAVLSQPFVVAKQEKNHDVYAVVKGGGKSAQAESVRLGISKALVTMDAELRKSLKSKGYLKRDPRKVERKKFGLKKARRAGQFSKR